MLHGLVVLEEEKSDPISDNSTVEISPNVTRKSIMGGFGCPLPISDAGFPEPMMSNQEIVKKLAELENATEHNKNSEIEKQYQLTIFSSSFFMIMLGETMFFSKQKIFLGILMSGITLLIYFSDSASSSHSSHIHRLVPLKNLLHLCHKQKLLLHIMMLY